jgi:hypothetical protein
VKKGLLAAVPIVGAAGLVMYSAMDTSQPAAPSTPQYDPVEQARKYLCRECYKGPRVNTPVCQMAAQGYEICTLTQMIAIMHPPGVECSVTNDTVNLTVGDVVTFVEAFCHHADMDGDCDVDLADYAALQRTIP